MILELSWGKWKRLHYLLEVLPFIWHNMLELIQSGVLLGTSHLPWLFIIEQIYVPSSTRFVALMRMST